MPKQTLILATVFLLSACNEALQQEPTSQIIIPEVTLAVSATATITPMATPTQEIGECAKEVSEREDYSAVLEYKGGIYYRIDKRGINIQIQKQVVQVYRAANQNLCGQLEGPPFLIFKNGAVIDNTALPALIRIGSETIYIGLASQFKGFWFLYP